MKDCAKRLVKKKELTCLDITSIIIIIIIIIIIVIIIIITAYTVLVPGEQFAGMYMTSNSEIKIESESQ